MFASTPAAPAPFPGFTATTPAPSQQSGDAQANPFGGGLSTRECFRVNEDNRLGARESTKPAFSWRNNTPSAAPASTGFTFPGAGDNRGLFGTSEKPTPVTGWQFGGNATPLQQSDSRGLFESTDKPAPTTTWHFEGAATPQPPPENRGFFGSAEKPTSVTGWHFGGTPAPAQPPAQSSVFPEWSGKWKTYLLNASARPPYAPTVERDPISGQAGSLISISSMPSYSHQSVEEMRLERGNKHTDQLFTAPSSRAAESCAWPTEKGADWTPATAFGIPPQVANPFASKESTSSASVPSNPFGRTPFAPAANGLTGNPFVPHTKSGPGDLSLRFGHPLTRKESDGLPHFHLHPPFTPIPKPIWPVFPSAKDAGVADVKPASGFTPMRFGVNETPKSAFSFQCFTSSQPPSVTPPTEPEVKEPELPVAVSDEDFPYGSGDFGAGLVEQTVKAALSNAAAKPDMDKTLALPVANSHRPLSRKIGGSRATAFVRRSSVSNSTALLAPGIRHGVAVPRKPTSNSPPAKKPIERIVVGRRDAEPWKRGGLHLKTSLFAKTIGSAALALAAVHDDQETSVAESVDAAQEIDGAGFAGSVDEDLDNYDL